MILKKIFIWSTIIFISISLIITGFTLNPKNNKIDETYTYVSTKLINNSDIKNIIEIIKFKNKYLYDIDNIDTVLKNLILKNLELNILLEKNGLTVTKGELLKNILDLDEFKINDVFSEKTYKHFLEKNQLTDFEFQNKLNKYLKKSQINNGLNVIKNNYGTKIKTSYKDTYKDKNYTNIKINKYIFALYKNSLTYIDLSTKKNITNLKLKCSILKKNITTANTHIFKFYVTENNKIKKRSIIINDKNIYNKINNHLSEKSFLINKNFILIKNDKEIKSHFTSIKKEIINSTYKKKSIYKIINSKKYIIKYLTKQSLNYDLLKSKKKICINPYSNKILNLTNLNNKNIKNNNYFIIKNEKNNVKQRLFFKSSDFFKLKLSNSKNVLAKKLKHKDICDKKYLLISQI